MQSMRYIVDVLFLFFLSASVANKGVLFTETTFAQQSHQFR